MRKLFLSIIAPCMVLLSVVSCGDPEVCPGEVGFVGGYNGEHVITIPSVGIPLPTGDSLTVTDPVNGDNKITALSQTLSTTLTCTINSSNCNKVLIDTIRIDSTTISGITIKDVVATGDGDISGSQLVTRITIVSGTAYNIPVYGTKPLAGTRINGIFNK